MTEDRRDHQGRNRAGLFMPAEPQVGDTFRQERAPGVAEDRSTIVASGLTVTVPAGQFHGCIETEDLDPLSGAIEQKFYCPGVGLVREVSANGFLDLVQYHWSDRSLADPASTVVHPFPREVSSMG